jgi:sugar transferase (PEP-CTERM/EpsH1 system associated)
LNILVISHRIPFPANKGEKIRTYNQIKYLTELGHKVHVVAPIENDDEIEFSKQLNEQNNINVTVQRLSAKPLRLLKGYLCGEPLSVANFYSAALQKIIDQIIQLQEFDFILCSSSAVAKYVYNNSSNNDAKLLMDFMDLDSDKWQQYADKSSFPMKLIYQREAKTLAAYEKVIQNKFNACFFIADTEVALFKKQNPCADNVFSLGNGLNTQEFYPAKAAPNNEHPVFIFTGVMDYKPNVDAVIWFVEECWAKITEHFPSAKFIIAGMNPNSNINKLSSIKGIEVTGFVDDILPYYHKADYFVAPFRLARGVQNKILQAFSCALPVISTQMGAEGINCYDNKEILIANSPAEFIEKILLLENNPELKDNIKQSALSLIKDEYSWQGKLKPLIEIINQ